MADTITDPADFMVAPLIGNILVMINKTCSVEDDVIVDMLMVTMDGKHILILVIEKCLAKLLSDKQSPFGSDLTGGKALDYVLAFASASSCADCLPDVSKLF